MLFAPAANAAIPGDLNQDCSIGSADVLLLWNGVTGASVLTPEQEDAADIAPVVGGTSTPDGTVDLADFAVLLRAIAGLQPLPDGVNIPKLNTLPPSTTAGYVDVTGTACAGHVVKLYVDGRLRGTATADPDGNFSVPLIGMAYGDNDFKATATAAGQTSGDSTEQTVDNDQEPIDRNSPALTGAVTVWPPSPQGPYQVNGDFHISSGNTLILPPETIVEFAPGSSFEVDGRLLAQGASGAAVTLRKSAAGRWDGILIKAGQGTLIQSALILGADNPIKVTGGNTAATLRGSELYEFLVGVDASGGASVTVDGTWIHFASNSGKGIVVSGADLTVTNSDINNLEYGIGVSGPSFATIGPGNEFKVFRDAAIQITGPADGLIIGNEIDLSATPTVARAQWGINLLNSSPEIRGNSIHGAETGIRVAGGSNPLITDGNEIYSNIWGIWLEGDTDRVPQEDADKVGNPIPIITNNSIHDNLGPKPTGTTRSYCSSQGANLCISDYPPGSNVFVDARGNYWGNNAPTTIRSSIINPDSSVSGQSFVNSPSDPVAIDLSNYRETENGGPGSAPLFLNAMTGVSHSPKVMAPTLGDVLSVQYTLITAADVTLRIYEERPPGALVRTISEPGQSAGLRSISWDGRDSANNFVSDEAYTYVLTTSVAGFSDAYNPPTSPAQTNSVSLAGLPAAPIPLTYNVHRNQPLKILFDMNNLLVGMNSDHSRMTVNRTLPGSLVTLIDKAPFPLLFNQLFVYDGFDPNGNLLEPASASTSPTFHFGHPIPMKRNAVIVERTKPLVSGPGYVSARKNPADPKTPPPSQMPSIEVKGDPYLVRLSYDQHSRITFCVDQAAYLTVKILKPGRGNPDIAADVVATLLQDSTPHAAQNCAPNAAGVPYVVEWDGTEPGGADPYLMRPVEDGSYTFTIEARNALQPNLRSIYRGIVQTRQ